MTTQHSVEVIVVNYKTADLVIKCLRSLESELHLVPNIHASVIDNQSQDGSLEKIQQAIQAENWQRWASLILAPCNGGFSYANNLAIRAALASGRPPTYFMLLNPDSEIRPGAVWELIKFMERNREVGLAGSCLENEKGVPWRTAFHFPTMWSEFQSGLRLGFIARLKPKWVVPRKLGSTETKVDWVPGASLMIRRRVFEVVGLMDEKYFLFYEETDLCLRAHRAGWSCWWVPQSRVMHLGGQSTGPVRKSTHSRVPRYWFESRRHFFVKNHGRFYAAVADILWTIGFVFWRLRRPLQRKPDSDPPHLLGDFLKNSTLVRLFG